MEPTNEQLKKRVSELLAALQGIKNEVDAAYSDHTGTGMKVVRTPVIPLSVCKHWQWYFRNVDMTPLGL